MTILLDDLLIRPFVGLLGVLHDMAIQELYDTAELENQLKENRLLYELGERTQAEYETRKTDLEAQLEEAREAREHLSGRARVIR